MTPADPQSLIEKIRALQVDRIAEIEDFVYFIRFCEEARALIRAATSAPAFAAIWSYPDDDAYDAL